MFRLILSAALFITGTAQALDNLASENCWDSTFFYRVASVERVNNKVQIGLRANMDLFTNQKPDDVNNAIFDDNAMELSNGFYRMAVYLVFEENECSLAENGDLSCSAQDSSLLHNRAFIMRVMDHFGEKFPVYSGISPAKISVKVDALQVTARIESDFNSFREITTRKAYCSLEGQRGGSHFGTAFFPIELQNFLNRP